MNIRNILSLVLLAMSFVLFAQVDRTKLPEPSTPRPIEIGDYESFELKNGLKVFVIENHKLPRVSFSLRFDRDPIFEGDKAGYLSMFGGMLRTGTETRTKEQLDEEIDFIGANLSGGSTSVFASGLSKYTEKILELMTDVAFNPTFPEEEFDKIKTQTLSGLASNKDDPNSIASNLNSILVYGGDHPYGELQTEETTNNVTVDDFKDYHANYFVPSIAYLVIVGDVDVKNMKKLVKTYFGSWTGGTVASLSYETPTAPEKTRVNIVNRGNSVQSVISVTYPVSLPIGHQDAPVVEVLNNILGGGFSSKLNMNLREDKGYTYGARSSLSPDELISRFSAGASVRNEVTDSSVVQILKEMKAMIDGEISDEELELAKNAIAGSFSRSLERPQTVANFALNTALYKLPADYYATYVQKVQAITKADVKAAAQKYVKPENAHINIVGKASDIAEKLAQFGEVKYFDMYGNEVDPAMAKLPDGLTAEKVLLDYIQAIGGKEKLAKVKNVKMNMEGSVMGQKMLLEAIKVSPNKSYTTVTMNGNVMQKEVFDGMKGSTSAMGRSQAIEGEAAKDKAIESALIEEIAYLEGGAQLTLSGMETIDGVDAYGLEVILPSGAKSTRYYSSESGLLVRVSRTIETPQGVMVMNTDIKEYGEYEGIKLPSLIQQPLGPGMKMDVNTTSVEINGEISKDLFKQ